MLKGILFALAACLVWGLIFVIPQMLTGFDSIEIGLGRYFFLGLFSLLLAGFQIPRKIQITIWLRCFGWAFFVGNFYYTSLVLGLRFLSPAIATLILGLAPITIAFYGNWKEKECDTRQLILPSLLIFLGLILVNFPLFSLDLKEFALLEYTFGLLCTLSSLVVWTWYVVSNAKFLKSNPNIPAAQWSTMIGVATFFWTLIIGTIYFLSKKDSALILQKYATLSPHLNTFLIGSLVLGVVCAWCGAYLWNRASLFLPMTIAGQLMIFETIFGLIFVYLYEQRLPIFIEGIGIILMLLGIYASIYSLKIKQTEYNQTAEGNI